MYRVVGRPCESPQRDSFVLYMCLIYLFLIGFTLFPISSRSLLCFYCNRFLYIYRVGDRPTWLVRTATARRLFNIHVFHRIYRRYINKGETTVSYVFSVCVGPISCYPRLSLYRVGVLPMSLGQTATSRLPIGSKASLWTLTEASTRQNALRVRVRGAPVEDALCA